MKPLLLLGIVVLLVVASLNTVVSQTCLNYGKMVCHKIYHVIEATTDCSLMRKRRQIHWGSPTVAPTPTRCPLVHRLVEKKTKILEKVLHKSSDEFSTPCYPNCPGHEKVVCRVKVCGSSTSKRYRVTVVKQFMKHKHKYGKICVFVKGKHQVCCYNNQCDTILIPTDTRGHRLIMEITMEVNGNINESCCEGGLRGYFVMFDPSLSSNGVPQASMTVSKLTGRESLTCPCESDKERIDVGKDLFGRLAATPNPGSEPDKATFSRRKRQGRISLFRQRQTLAEILRQLYGPRPQPKTTPTAPLATTAPPTTTAPSITTAPPKTRPPQSCPEISCVIPDDDDYDFGSDSDFDFNSPCNVNEPTYHLRYFFNSTSEKCEEFYVDNVTKSNETDPHINCFQSLESCQNRSEADVFDGCPCNHSLPSCHLRYFFYSLKGLCEEAYMDDVEKCDTADPPINCYKSLASCQKKCTNVCHLPWSEGMGDKKETRYYYDFKENKCVEFYYKGMGGTGNNFKTAHDCQKECALAELGINGLQNCLEHPDEFSTCKGDPKLKCLVDTMMQCPTE